MLILLCCTIPLLPLQNVIYRLDAPLRSVPGVNFLNVMALALLFVWVTSTVGRGRPLLGASRYNKVLGFYVLLTYLGLWRSVSFVNAPMPLGPSDPNFVFWKDYVTNFVVFFTVANVMDDERSMRTLTVLMLLVLPYMIWVHKDHVSWIHSWHYDDDMRVRGTMMHLGSNELAAFYVIALSVVLGLLVSMKGLRWRVYLLGCTALLGWGVSYSYSRSAYLGGLLGVAVIGLVKSRKLALALVAFLVVAPFILPASIQDRFGMIGGEQTKTDESTQKRMDLWEAAWESFKTNPILGTGYRSFPYINKYGMDTHNMYLKALCELGIAGFLLLFLQFLVGAGQGWRLMRGNATPFSTGLGLGLLAATAAAMFLNVFGDRSSYLAVTGHYWAWQAMAARILRARGTKEGWQA